MISLDWIPGAAIGAAGAILSMWRSSAVMEQKIEALKTELARNEKATEKDGAAVAAELRELIRELRNVATQVTVIAAEQAVINKVTAHALEGLVDKQEVQSKQINEHAASLSLIRELMQGKLRS